MIAREEDVTTKREDTAVDEKINSKAPSSSASSWSRLKDPRIVRVSRAFGGKDRHSKVCTVRGLRDRRVRLSVPTAIQLYDLQDRLGLNQPSKVVDWLLNAAKHEIDELPPLQMPPGNYNQNLQPVLASHGVGAPQSSKEGFKIGSSTINWDDPLGPSASNMWNSDAILRPKPKELPRESKDEEEKQCHFHDHGSYDSSNNFFSRHSTHSATPGLGLLHNSAPGPYSSLIRWDPSTLSLSQSGSPAGLTPGQADDFHNFNVVSLASTVSNTPSGPQVVIYQPAGVTQSYFPSHVAATAEYVPKKINFQMLNSSSENPFSNSLTPPIDSESQPGRPFHFISTTNRLFPTQNDRSGGDTNNENEFHSR